MRIHLTPQDQDLIAQQKWGELRHRVHHWRIPEVTRILEGLRAEDAIAFYRILPPSTAAGALSRLRQDRQIHLLDRLDSADLRRTLEAMDSDDRTRLLSDFPRDRREAAVSMLEPLHAKAAVELLAYADDSVGRLMSSQYVAVRRTWSIREALAHVRSAGMPASAIATVYVADDALCLVDMLDLAHFVLADPDSPVESIMDGMFAALSPEDDRELAVNLMLKYDAVALPVVDSAGRILGVVTVDDIFDVAEEEVTEDFQKQAAMSPLERPYLESSVWVLVRNRIPWLAGLIAVYLAASRIITSFEQALAANIFLASFIPLLMGTAGNVGTQAGTLVVRSMATGQLDRREWQRVLLKELAVGTTVAILLGLLTAMVAGYQAGLEVAVVTSLAMISVVVVANIFGVMLPIALAGAGIDPAMAGSPIITSFTDLTSLLIYLSLATQLLRL